MSRERKQELFLEELTRHGLTTVGSLAFAEDTRTHHVHQQWLAAVKSSSSKPEQWPYREWPRAARVASSLMRQLPAGTVLILHNYANEVGALVLDDRDLVDAILASWPIKRFDFAAIVETGDAGLHVEYNFGAHNLPEFYPDGSIDLIAWGRQAAGQPTSHHVGTS
jgi:hypothetical protein